MCKKYNPACQFGLWVGMRGISAVGSARHSHCRGQGFESPMLHAEVRTGNRFGFFLVFPLHQCNPNKLFLVGDRFGLFLYFAPDEQSARQAEKNNANEKRGTEPASGPVPLHLSSGCLVGRAIVPSNLHGLLTLPLGKFPLTLSALKKPRYSAKHTWQTSPQLHPSGWTG